MQLAAVVSSACLLTLLGCTVPGNTLPPGALVSRTAQTIAQEQITVSGGGRDIHALVLLPDSYPEHPPYGMLLAIHNFAGDSAGFADLIHAEQLRRLGLVVVLPQALGLVPEWQGPGITITVPDFNPAGQRIDDGAGLIDVLDQARLLYQANPDRISVLGFSQGATLALDVARRLDQRRPGAVHWMFLAAGSLARPVDGSLALPGTSVIDYQPGHNGMQDIANFLTGEPDQARFIPQIVAAKGCALTHADSTARTEEHGYACHDGGGLTILFEPAGEHAWPGQDAKYDSSVMGAGSGSAIDFTAQIVRALSAKGS